MTKVYLYSDRYGGRSIIAQGLQAVLRPDRGFQFEFLTWNTLEYRSRVEPHVPNVLLLDLSLTNLPESLREIHAAAPYSKVALLVETISTELALLAMRQGVRGILRKELATDSILNVIQKIHRGEYWFEGALAEMPRSDDV